MPRIPALRRTICAVLMGLGAPGISFAVDPSVCVVVDDGTPVLGQPIGVSLVLGSGDPVIAGAQLAIRYDPVLLAYDGVAAGTVCDAASPFAQIVSLVVDEAAGEIVFSVIVLGSPGSQGPATLACLDFVVTGQQDTDVCLVDEPSLATFLSRLGGGGITPDNSEDCPAEPPALSCGHVPEPSSGECDRMDSDGDGDIDLRDFAAFQLCFDTSEARTP